ncbi:MAG TPA: V-type ATPase 116kDa subunit family protein [Verrucomicrobiae bacterium]|nr:V-type ATPase 116kDa subunit family protein [Verrucomicrobiae bacterium]
MARLHLVVLEQDERNVLCYLGRAGVLQLTRTPAGPDTAPSPPRNPATELARVEHLSSRLENLRRSLELPAKTSAPATEISSEQIELNIQQFEKQSAGLLEQRQRLQQRLTEIAAVDEQISDYRGLDLPLDQPDENSFLHFVTGSLPAKNFSRLEIKNATVIPIAERDGQQIIIGLTTRLDRPDLDRALQQIGFQPQKLPVLGATTTGAVAEQNRREEIESISGLKKLNAQLQTLAGEFAPACAQMETAVHIERQLLEAEQNFPRTENSLLITGWSPENEIAELKSRIHKITGGRCILKMIPAEKLPDEEIPVLLRQPRWLRPFALLVTAYGLPEYRELEPTLFVAISYLVMFGMMFGDVGHGLVLAVIGLVLLRRKSAPPLREIGLLLTFAGSASMVFGALYGSCFGLESLKKFALWHDPLAGNPMSLMLAAIKIGIGMISLGLVLNIINRLRHGDFTGALLDKFGAAGAVFYWLALALFVKYAAIRERGFLIPILLLLAALAVAWMLKEPVHLWQKRRAGRESQTHEKSTIIIESFVSVFEGLLSYFANTISFVRLAAYAMSHAALLLAALMISENVKHFPAGGGFLAVLVIILGNIVALVLEGIVASVQALRLEYYEFFGKFFFGNGKPFQPFRLQTTTVAHSPS